jgi:arylformamidase
VDGIRKQVKMSVYDVSVVLRPDMPVWPGEPGFEIERIHSIREGAGANVSVIRAGCHTGTHIDAPLHFIDGGKSIEQLSLDLFIGRARIFSMDVQSCIDRSDLESIGIREGDRVLFKTSNSGLWEWNAFRTDFVYITEDAASHLVEVGVRTVGIDYLSVEKYGLDHAPAHHILLGAGIGVIEGLDLRGVDAGEYELVCLPLKLQGSDGAPARVFLRDIG